MKIGILTSSRADYGIYLPLLKELKKDSFFKTEVIAFGTHLSQAHGYTLNQIVEDGFQVPVKVDTMPAGDTPQHISEAMGKAISAFSKVWQQHRYDLVFCLGDRYEMFAACAASVPFNVNLAHIHGGEQTLGAIDEAFRHSITHMAHWHFTTTDIYKNRVVALKGNGQGVYNVGALSIDNLKELPLLSISEFKERWKIDLSIPSILITFHPETVSFEKNAHYADELVTALEETRGYQLVITMPNADTMGNMIRKKINTFIASHPQAIGVESFGTLGYLSCMKHCAFMLGNTSSGFVEAAYFPKYVINLGNRQDGRIISPNIRNCPIGTNDILNSIAHFKNMKLPATIDIYG
ncbi:MAG: UDP-N-acetylglucosamine 2-epimerase, partial [Bacteroidota bacterium]